MANAFSLGEWADMMADTVTIDPWLSNSVSGVPLYAGTPITYSAYIEMKNHRIIDHLGREVMAKGRVFLGPAQPSTLDLYPSLVEANGAVAHYRFDDAQAASGLFPLTDMIGGANGVSPSAGVAITPRQPGATSDGDTSALLNGSAGAYYTVPDNSIFHLTSQVSFDIWFKIPTGTAGSAVVFFASSLWNIEIKFNGSQFPILMNIGGVSVVASVVGLTAVLDSWRYLVVTYDGSFIRVYLDRILVGSTAATGLLNLGTNGFNIGATTSGLARFVGYLDEASIYNRVLSQSDITTQMNVALGNVTVPTTISVKDKVRLPAEYTPTTPPILAVNIANDEFGNHHTVLEIG